MKGSFAFEWVGLHAIKHIRPMRSLRHTYDILPVETYDYKNITHCQLHK